MRVVHPRGDTTRRRVAASVQGVWRPNAAPLGCLYSVDQVPGLVLRRATASRRVAPADRVIRFGAS